MYVYSFWQGSVNIYFKNILSRWEFLFEMLIDTFRFKVGYERKIIPSFYKLFPADLTVLVASTANISEEN